MNPETNALDALNIYLQRKKKSSACLSWLDKSSGSKHEPVWTSTCKLDEVEIGTGSDRTKRLARTAAAKVALAKLEAREAEVAAP